MTPQIIQYLLTQYPKYVSEMDSYQAIPLHLASSYPSSSLLVLQLLIQRHPNGAKEIDHRSQMPLHRACKSRISLDKVLTLVEVCPEALLCRDYEGNTPLEWAERMDHSLSDVCPEVVEVLTMVNELLGYCEYTDDIVGTKDRVEEILMHFRSLQWWRGLSMAFSTNISLLALMNLPSELSHQLIFLLCRSEDQNESVSSVTSDYERRRGVNDLFSILIQRPDILLVSQR